jgi:tRNA(Ile)-lysidine synthase
MDDLLEHVRESIHTRSLFRRGQPILVAVSGGLDSMVLLHVLHELSSEQHWELTVAHLNHQLRGRRSDMDERLVCGTTKRLGCPVVVERANVRQFARASKLSLEMAARRIRHDFLARTAVGLQVGSIALAHHADDQVELFFLRLLRGSGGEGLAGMKWSNPSPVDSQIRLVRPMLDQSKAALREFAKARQIRFREDASNAWLDILRNRIRHELIPLLTRKYQPALARTILRVMGIVGAEAEVVGQVAEFWLAKKTRAKFTDLPVAVQRRCIHWQLLRLGVPLDFDLVEQLRLRPNRAVSVGTAIHLTRDPSGNARFVQKAKAAEFRTDSLETNLAGTTGEITFGQMNVRWRIQSKGTLPRKRPPRTEFFAAEKVGRRITLRHWRPGDTFQPIGMSVPVKLQDVFTNQKIPAQQRRGLVLATTAEGEIFWVEGQRIAERFKLTRGAKRRLQWRWKRL